MSQSVINFKIDKKLKSEAERVFAGLGISTTQAMKMFLMQVIYQNGIPFELKLPVQPNETTLQAMRDAESGNTVSYENIEALFDDMDS
jgi:DNA-damage-inducible protein J